MSQAGTFRPPLSGELADQIPRPPLQKWTGRPMQSSPPCRLLEAAELKT